MTKAIVTLAVGDEYQALWETKARPSWERYAARHGYEIIALHEPIDPSPEVQRSMAWQKLLILGHPKVSGFDRVVWLDCDLIINAEAAPCIVQHTPEEKVGAVLDMALLSHPGLSLPFELVNNWRGSNASFSQKIYELNGLRTPAPYFINGGVLVLSRSHREVLEHVYRTYRQGQYSYYEQIGLSYELLTRGLHHALLPQFNALWLEYRSAAYPFVDRLPAMLPMCIAVALRNSFFLHFAGHRRDMEAYDPDVVARDRSVVMGPRYIQRVASEWTALAEAGAKTEKRET
ncbi:MAG TPA: hypothetical protein VIM11_06760 [Tepidisphaeraceae bacterium]|jgi:hypothetical protein